MISIADIMQEATRIQNLFTDAGAQLVTLDVLQDAEALLDLYGEDIRARAYVTHDPVLGEMMLRPDFTLPIVQTHMQQGAEPARYAYRGKVFRKQEEYPDRTNEYIQVGYEVFDRLNPAQSDAEVFALMSQALDGLPLRVATGDMGILMAAVRGLNTSSARKDALIRHIWRPRRFRALLDRFSGKSDVPPSRKALLEMADPFVTKPVQIGLRSRGEIMNRIDALQQDASIPPISKIEVDLIDAIQNVRETCPNALQHLHDLAVDMPAIETALSGLVARVDALDRVGVDVDSLDFEGSYGRTSMEYYDGFVFGFYAENRADLPPIATGGRYDALTRNLGAGREIPAVGGVVRPDLALILKQGTNA